MEKQLDLLSGSQSGSEREDPWGELLQTSCAIDPEAGPIRPLSEATSLLQEHVRKLAAIFSHQSEIPRPEILKSPLNESSQIAQSIAFLLGKKWGCKTPPLSPRLFPGGGTLLCFGPSKKQMGSLPQLIQLALLWLIAGETEAAEKLIRWLLPLASLPSIWSSDEEYNEEEWFLSYSLLFRTVGNKDASLEFLKKVKKGFGPFWAALAKSAPPISLSNVSRSLNDPVFGLTQAQSQKITAVFTLTGSNSSLGVIRAGDVEIRAFGPQPLPFDGAKQFGIDSLPLEGCPPEWTCCQGDPELWFQMKTEMREEGCAIDLKFAGLKPEKPFAVAFYVKANRCQIGNQNFKPKTLHRYSGEGKALSLQGKEGELKIETSASHKIQVIPLAGEGCFWNTDFLITFEMHPLIQSIRFDFY